jgi:mannose-6-phosphate isomerase-like protein (cupin superfamily)
MIIKGTQTIDQKGRTGYELSGFSMVLNHFAVRETTSDTPFIPHKHENKELWYIISGTGYFQKEETEEIVSTGDLIRIDPWMKHGLRTEERINWICLG